MRPALSADIKELGEVTGKSVVCGWMFDEVAWFMHSFISLIRPDVVIQTGHLWGKSACVILDALRYKLVLEGNPQQPDGAFDGFVRANTYKSEVLPKLISVDPAPYGVPAAQQGFDWLLKHYEGQFEHYEMTSVQFFRERYAALVLECAGKRLLGIVDGDHTDEGCLEDLLALEKLGAAAMIVDDTDWLPHLCAVSSAFAQKYGYSFINLPYMNGIGVLVRNKQ